MLKIGEFSKLSRVSIRMLRHYDEIGLLKPAYIDPDSGYRYYAEHQLTAAGRITALKDMGFGLSSMAQILACDSKEMLASHMLVRQAELEEQIHLLSDQLRRLDTALTRLRKDETMQYDVTVKTFPARCAATVRMQIPSYEMEGMLWNMLVSETQSLNIVEDNPCYCCAVFHDKEFKESDVDVEVYKTVKGSCSKKPPSLPPSVRVLMSRWAISWRQLHSGLATTAMHSMALHSISTMSVRMKQTIPMNS